ncbi:MAG: lipoyl synthase [Gammaproteobacteria bacterium]|nr:lipoyl synthase [Gammaproteobacteria bacterium]NNF60759.1 lipoyl synthase [Gammaproteobacteria bacterium]NNM20230.1 lipoyl synthase [Gammaproteobacteria bacterium]
MTAAEKMARIPVKIEPTTQPLRKPPWLRVKSPATPAVANLKKILRENRLYTVCEEATCPNIAECFGKGTATFMIMGDICTRRCTFCDVAHGRPAPLDTDEPANLARTIAAMKLRYVVITSVDRDDLRDGGAAHFAECIGAVRADCPETRIEVLVPDFRGRMDQALAALDLQPPDVFNHNVETVPRLYRPVRPGSDINHSLTLLAEFGRRHPQVPTKSGIMLGLGEELGEVAELMQSLREHNVDMITIGQYLQPSRHHHPVIRFVTPEEFAELERIGYEMGFSHVASGPLVRSSYHADQQAQDLV